ncbi:Hypothetical protein CINCED_3A000738 [Cinara cedri]|nr:Hypothetical protein CINCED_3A000738 [Cinara cedri]
MFFMYMLISVMAVSTVFFRVTNTQPIEVTFGDIESQSESEASLSVMEHNDRESNLRYVMAIENSSFWTEIKKRSLTISSELLTSSIINKSPENLSDEELTQLKQVCQDGLKCVAVDHLLILTQVMQPTDDGKTSVRTAITKITKVLTQYTNEYHENTNQYEEVTDKDDTAKVYSSVTTIVEDNEELCQIDSNTYTRSNVNSYATSKTNAYLSSYENANENSNKSSVDNPDKTSDGSPSESSGSSLNGNSDEDTEKEGPLTIVNNGNINFGNINTFNVNEGTMNSATVNLDLPKNPDDSNMMPTKIEIHVDSEPSTPELDNTSTSQNDDQNTNTSQDKGALDDGKESLNYLNIYEYGSKETSNTATPDRDTKTVNNPNQGNSSPKTVVPADSSLAQIKSNGKTKAEKPTDTNGGAIHPN